MKRFLRFLALAALMCVPWVTQAQTTVEIGEGTVTTNQVPIGTYYNYSITEMLYTSEEIGMAGTISSISFYYLGIAERDLPITVYMANVDAADLSTGISLADANQVFSGTLSVTTTAGWVTIELDTPFEYDGSSNLLIGCIKDYLYYFSGQSWQGTTVSNMARYTQSDSNGPYTTSTVPGTAATVRPNIQIDIIPAGGGPICNRPTGLTATLTPGNGTIAQLTWNAGGTETAWQICLNDDEENLIDVDENPYTLTGLTPEAVYTAKVRAVCSFGESNWSSTVTFIPTNAYTITVNDGTTTNGNVPIYGFYADEGVASQFIIPAESLSSIVWATINELTFYSSSASVSWGVAQFEVYVMETNETTLSAIEDWSDMELVKSAGILSISANKMVVTLTSPYQYQGGNLMIGFKQTVNGSYVSANFYGISATGAAYYEYNSYSGITGSVQDFLPKTTFSYIPGTAPTCARPTGFAVTDSTITPHTAELSWTAGDEETSWQLCINGDEENLVDVTDNPYTIDGLDPETAYSVKLRADCGDNDYSNWTAPVTFTTPIACEAPTELEATAITDHEATLGWTGTSDSYNVQYRLSPVAASNALFFDGFENGMNNWTIVGGEDAELVSGQSQLWYTLHALDGNEISHNGDSCASSWSWNNDAYQADNYLISPQVTLGGAVSFWVYTNYAYPDSYEVLLSTTGNEIANFTVTLQAMAPAPSNGVWNEVTIDLSEYTGEGYIAIHHVDYDANYLLIDDFGVYGLGEEWTETTTTDSTLPLTGLDPETTYDFKVQGVCGDEVSRWVSTSFTTLPSCLAPTDLEVSDVTAYTATISFESEGTAWQYCLNGDEENPVDITENPYTITGLSPETEYTVKVRNNCGGDYSAWTAVESFTTPVSCVAPTNLIVDNILSTSADLSWDGDENANSYELKYYIPGETTVLMYDNGSMQANVGNSSVTKWNWGVMYPASMISGNYLTKVAFYEVANSYYADGAVTINIYSSVSATEPETLLSTQTIATEGTNGMREVYINPVQIDPSQNLWIILSANATYCMTMSNEDGGVNSRWIYYNGEWLDFGTMYTTGAAYSFMIRAYYETSEDLGWTSVTGIDNPYTMQNLQPGTSYFAGVRANCGDEDGDSYWTFTAFTTLPACPEPTEVAVVAGSIAGHVATLEWEGYSDAYNIDYRTAAYMNGVNESFDASSIPSGWAMYTGLFSTSGTVLTPATYGWTFGTGNNVFNSHARCNIYGNYQRWLVTPAINVAEGFALNFDMALTVYSSGSSASPTAGNQPDDKFIVLVSTDNMATWTILRQWDNAGSDYVYDNITNTGDNVTIDLSDYAGQTVNIAFYGESTVSNGDNNLHIDNVSCGFPVAAGEWQHTTANEATVTLTGLNSETIYEVRVMANCGNDGESEWSDTVTFTTAVACPAPTALTVSANDITTTTAVLNWTENGVADAWQLCLNGNEENLIAITENPYTLTGLTPGTEYTAKVRANCGEEDGQSAWSNTVTFTTVATCPSPTEVAVDNITAHTAEISWTAEASSYIVMVGQENVAARDDFETGTMSSAFTTTTASYPWTVVANDHSGAYCAKSGNTAVNSSTSDMVLEVTLTEEATLTFSARISSESNWDKGYFSIDGVVQSDLNGISGDGVWLSYSYLLGVGTHTLRWYFSKDSSASGNDDCFYVDDIAVKTAPATWDETHTASASPYELTGLASESSYQVKVKAVCGNESSEPSEAVTFVTAVACHAPTALTAGTPDFNTVELSWTENGTAEEWIVAYKLAEDEDFTEVTATTNPYTLQNLIDGVAYTAKVRANCGEEGPSAWSNTVSFTTVARCLTPTELVFGTPTTDGVAISWTAGSTETNWTVTVGNNEPVSVSDEPTYMVTGLEPNTTYTVSIVANCGGEAGVSNTPLTGSFTTAYENFELPYSTTFAEGHDNEWRMVNGTHDNKWYIGEAAGNPARSMYISNDGGLTHAYNNSGVCVAFAYAGFNNFEADKRYTVEFDWICKGETGNYDFIRAWIVPDSLTFAAGTSYPTGMTTATGNPTGWISLDNNTPLKNVTEWQHKKAFVTVPADGAYKIVFMWRQDSGTGTNPPAAVDNVSIVETPKYTVTTSVSMDGEVAMGTIATTPDSLENIYDGTNVTLTATAEQGYQFVNWTEGDEVIGTNNTLTFVIDTNRNIVANFEYAQYVITANSNDTNMGTVTVEPSDTAYYNDNVTLTATPVSSCYEFVNWTSGEEVITEPTFSIQATENKTYTANFQVKSYTGLVTADVCDSYTWDDSTYTESTIVDKTMQTVVDGCDSIVTLNLTVRYSTTAIDEQTACDSYTWIDNVTYTVSNNEAQFTLENVAGCDSLVTLNLTVNYSNSETVVDTINENELPYTFMNNVYTAPVVEEEIAAGLNVGGCDSTVIFTLIVHMNGQTNDFRTICDNELPYTWNSVVFTEAGMQSVTLEDQYSADSIVNMYLTVKYGTHTTENVVTCDEYTWFDVTYNESNTYVHQYTNGEGCASDSTLNLTINLSNTGDTTAVACNSFEWYGETYESTPEVAPTHEFTNVAGCDSTVTLNLTINNSQTVVLDPVTACDSAMWNNTMYYQSGEQSVTTTGLNGCDSTTTIVLTINNSQTVVLDPVAACDSVMWNNTWYYQSGEQSVTTTGLNGCDSTTTVVLTINHGQTVALDPVTACDSFAWNGQTYYQGGNLSFATEDVNGCDSTTTVVLTINNSNTGDTTAVACNSFTWYGTTYTSTPAVAPTHAFTNVAGCDSTVTLNLTINNSQTVTLDPIVACDSAMWNNTMYYQSGEQSVTTTGLNGCDSTTTIVLTINHSQTVELNPVTAYDSYEWNGETYTESGLLTFITEGANGCDSTTTVVLTINHYDSITVVLTINDATMGTTDPVAGTYRFYPGQTVSASATPNSGYEFVGWAVGNDTLRMAQLSYELPIAMAGMTFNVEAVFAQSGVGIETADYSNINIFSADNKVYVKGAEGMNIYIYDVNGRCMARRANAADTETFTFDMTGVVLVKAGNAPAKRVVLVR